MKQDKGIKKRIVTTGKLVETTGLMMHPLGLPWIMEIQYKNGKKKWFREYELKDI